MATPDSIQRGILPIPDRKPIGLTTYDAKDPETKFLPIKQLRPPADAPNVLVILLDDVRFGASSVFGGPCRTPTAERLAADGLRYNRFHTTALCSPSRAAMLSGRNHHAVGMGGITEIATSAPGYNSLRPNTSAPLAEILKLNGYSRAQFGKCHEVPVFETTPIGPYQHWPTGSGFEHGFIGGESNQYHPALYDGTTPVERERTPEEGYYLGGRSGRQSHRLGATTKAVTLYVDGKKVGAGHVGRTHACSFRWTRPWMSESTWASPFSLTTARPAMSQREDQVGADRYRCRRQGCRPHDRRGRALQSRDGNAIKRQ